MTDKAEFERLLDVYGFRCERFGQDLSTHARAQVVSAFAALASAPVAEPRLEWSAKALYDAIKDVLLNHRLSNLVDEDGEFFPLVDHLRSQDDKTTESGEFEIALICDAIYNDVLTKSAPVAGEAIQKARHDTAHADTERERVTALAYWLDQQTFEPGMLSCAAATLRAMLSRDAAPQASAEDGRNAALEEAAKEMDRLHAQNRRWHNEFREAAAVVRALKKPQSANDGGTLPANWLTVLTELPAPDLRHHERYRAGWALGITDAIKALTAAATGEKSA